MTSEVTPLRDPIWKMVVGRYVCRSAVAVFVLGQRLQRSDISAYGFELGMSHVAIRAYIPVCPSCQQKVILLNGAHPDHSSPCGLKEKRRVDSSIAFEKI